MTGSAVFSADGKYRYRLERHGLGGGYPMAPVNFVMLNPSTATADVSDPTVRRCEGFARAWGYDNLIVTNLYALRSTDPKVLLWRDPVGEGFRNDEAIRRAAEESELVIVAWGAHKAAQWREWMVLNTVLDGIAVHSLGTTKHGAPRHPLYVRGDTKPLPYRA